MKFDIDSFPWESVEHKKAFMALFQYLKKHDIDPRYDDVPPTLLAAFLIQKSQEAQEWWTQTFGEHVKQLRSEISDLRDEVRGLKKA